MSETIETENTKSVQVEYAKFWNRAGAYIIDVMLLVTLTMVTNYINIANFKSFLIYLPVAIITIMYKPYMESRYGATLGKMALGLKVTDQNFNQINFSQSFLRSLILIFPAILYIPFYYLAFNNSNLAELDGFFEFTKGLASEYLLLSLIGNLASMIGLVDLIVLLTDQTNAQRALHDRIAKTFVITDSD